MTTRASDVSINQYIVGSWRREGTLSYNGVNGVSISVTKDVLSFYANGTMVQEATGIAFVEGSSLNTQMVAKGKYSISNGQISYSQIVLDLYFPDNPSKNKMDISGSPTFDVVNFISGERMKVTSVEDGGPAGGVGHEYYRLQ